ncbi:MAG: DoxX family protein [Actinophytocola sp.]|nr:DoxX family protein [Actinophytocola sp.]
MFTAYVVVTAITVGANVAIVVADFARARFVVDNSIEVGVPQSWLPYLGTLKGAGAVGLILGLAGVPVIGIAAAIGLVLFYIGAVAAHVRARVFYNIAFPGGFLALAVGSLVIGLAQ